MDTHIGQYMKIAAGLPATFNEAGYEAMTWVEVAGGITLPATQNQHDTMQVPNLKAGRTHILKGMRIGQASNMAFFDVDGDAGQALLKAQDLSRGETSVAVFDDVSGEVTYASGIITNYSKNERSGTTHKGFTASFTPNYEAVIV